MLHDWFFCQSVYSEQECAELFDIAKNNPSKVYSDRHGKMNGKNVDVTVAETKVFGDKLDLFFNVVYGVNEEIFGFKLFPNRPLGLTLNNYSIGQEYPFHKDHSNNGSAADVKLTAVLNLSNQPFTGGDFEFFTGKETKVPEINAQGSMLVFPSFLYHRVTPVLSGNRISLSCWFTGPNWR